MDNSFAEILQVLQLSDGEVTSCDINVNHVLAIGSSDKLVRVMEWKKGLGFVEKNYSPVNYHRYGVTCVKFSPKGTMLSSSSLDGTAIIFDVLTGAKIYKIVQHNAISIIYSEFTPDSTKFITVGDDATCCFWNLLQHCQIRYFQLYENEFNIKGLSISPDSEYLISVCSEGLINLWFVDDISTKEPQSLLTRRDIHEVISSCDFSPVRQVTGDGQLLKSEYRIATCGTEGSVKVWDIIVRRSQGAKNFKCDLLLLHILKGHDSDVYSVRFNSDGHYLASVGLDNYVNFWQVTSGEHKAKLKGHTKFVTSCVFSKNSLILVTCSTDKTVIVWNLMKDVSLDSDFSVSCNISSHFTNVDLISYHSENEAINHTENYDEFEVLQTLTLPSIVNTVHFSGNDLLALAGGNKTISIWRKEGHAFVEDVKLEEHKYSVNYLDISPCGSKIISSSVSGETIFWDLEMNLSFKMKNPNKAGGLRTCRFSPNSKLIAAAGENQEVYLWDAHNLQFLMTLEKGDSAITSAAFTPDSKFLVTVCFEGSINLYDVEKGIIKAARSNAHDLGILCCDFSSRTPNDEIDKNSITRGMTHNEAYLLATCGNDSFVKLWKVKPSEIKISGILPGHRGAVTHVKFSQRKNTILASCASDTTIRIWDTKLKTCLHSLDGHKSTVTACSFSQDLSLLLSGSLDKTVIIWRLTKRSRPQIEKPSTFSKPLEKWTPTDIGNWFISIGWTELANKIKNSSFNGMNIVCHTDDSIAAFYDLEYEHDKEKLKEKLQWLRKESNSFCMYNKCFAENIPHKYLCPITHQIMKNPVICSDGFTYDQDSINEWFIGGNFTSPVTGECLTSTKLLPNLTLKIIIYKFLFGTAEKV